MSHRQLRDRIFLGLSPQWPEGWQKSQGNSSSLLLPPHPASFTPTCLRPPALGAHRGKGVSDGGPWGPSTETRGQAVQTHSP